MLEFYAPLFIASALTLAALLRLARARFLSAVDLAIVSTFYYAVPLAIAGFFRYNPRHYIFLHRAAGDPSIALQSLHYATAAIVALALGRLFAQRLGAPGLRTYFVIRDQDTVRLNIAFAGVMGLIVVGIWLFGLGDFLRGYATESTSSNAALGNSLVFFSVGALGMVLSYAVLLRQVRGRTPFLVILASLVVLLAILVVRAKRLEVVTALLPVAILLLSRRASFKVTAQRLALAGVAVAGLTLVAVLRIGSDFDSFFAGFYILAEGLYAGHSLPGIIERINGNMLGYENGARLLNALLGFVPRAVLPGKDDLVYAGNLALEGVAPLGATTLLSEVVLQGGMVAVAITYLTMGFLFERLGRFEDVWDAALATGNIPARFAGYLVCVAICVPHFRDGIIPAVKLTLQALAFFLVLSGLRTFPRRLLAQRRPLATAG